MTDILNEEETRNEYLAQALKALNAMIEKYHGLTELEGVYAAVQVATAKAAKAAKQRARRQATKKKTTKKTTTRRRSSRSAGASATP